ncbi:PP2C family protein-serine/threonine phosphatase [Methanogenium cariaci]|jgi:PPM family protein phosphatase
MKPDTTIRERFEYSAISIAGVRPVNEDAWCVAPMGKGLVCAVADGIGGHEAGDVASALAIQIFEETVREAEMTAGDPETAAAFLKRGHTLAHAAIRQQATGTRAGMGTTLVSAGFLDGTVSLCNTGDSRCTLIRRGTVLPLTTDHSFVQDLVDRDILTPEEAASHPMRNIITHSLGGDFVAECTVHPLCTGDTLVISSDGLHDYVSREMMVLAGEMLSTEDAARLLMDEAAKTSTDNITLIVVRVHGEAIRQKESE